MNNIDKEDPWDLFLLKEGERMIKENICFDYDPEKEEDCLEIAELFCCGGQYPGREGDFFGELSFGDFGTGSGPLVTLIEKPENIPTPQDVDLWREEFPNLELQWSGYGQPDGPGSEGLVWIARIWDASKNDQIIESRCMADKLSWVIGYSFKFLREVAESSLD